MSRAEAARGAGVSAPTASKAIDNLLRAGLLEETEPAADVRGRPARRIRLAVNSTQVLGLAVDAARCQMAAAGLDGRLHEDRIVQFPTPATYEALVELIAGTARSMMSVNGVKTLGLGISLPGLMDSRAQVGLLSPNLPITNGRALSLDVSEKIGIECEMVQESHALCLAERHFGLARTLDDYAMLHVSAGISLGVISGGRLLSGHSGFAGEVGHTTVAPKGGRCGCGNNGCLETVASERAFAKALANRTGRDLTVDDALAMLAAGDGAAVDEWRRVRRFLVICVANVVNLYNPATLFLHGRLFAATPDFVRYVTRGASRRALGPSITQCTIRLAEGSQTQGAVAAVIERLLDQIAPGIRPR